MQGSHRLLLPALGFASLVTLFSSRDVFACGQAEPFNYFSFGAPTPSDASTGVPLDTPIVVGVNAYSIGGSPIVPSFLHVEEAALSDEHGNVAALRSPLGEPWRSTPFSQVFAPAMPLSANTRYHFSARIAPQDVPRPTDATGSDRVDFEFTTGAELAPALTLTGELEVSVTTEQLPNYVSQNCGDPVQSGTRSARIAHVLLPAASGGSGLVGYQGVVYLSDETAIDVGTERPFTGTVSGHEVNLQTWVELEPDQRQMVAIELPVELSAYHPCFALQVWDPGERHVATVAQCLAEPISPHSDAIPANDEQPDAGTVSDDQPDASSPSSPSSPSQASPSSSSESSSSPARASEACSVVGDVGERGSRTWPGLVLSALFGLAMRARRTRRCH